MLEVINKKQFLDEIQKTLGKVIRIAETESKRFALKIQSEIRLEWPVGTGESRNRILVRKLSDGGYEVYAQPEYAKYIDDIDPDVEYVRRPGSKLPPLDNVAEWAKRKNIVGGSDYDSLPTDERGIVFLIARKIAKDGIKNLKIFYRTQEKYRDIIERDITKAITDAL